MTVIRPNSVSGITSITAQANEINVFRSNGTLAGLNLNGVNFNTTAGISTLAALKITGNLDVEGVLTYQDVTNVDSVGIVTARQGVRVTADGSPSSNYISVGASNDLKIYHSGSHSRILDDATGKLQLGSDTEVEILNGSFNESMAKFQPNGAVELFHNNERKIFTHASGIQVEDATSTGASIVMATSSGTSGSLYATGNNTLGLLDGQNHYMLKGVKDGAVELYHDNTKRLETTSSGVEIPHALFVGEKIDMPDHTSGTNGMILLGTGDDLYMYHDGTNSHLRNNTGTFNIRAGSFRLTDAAIQHVYLNANSNGNDEIALYYDNSVKLTTTNTGAQVFGLLEADTLGLGDNDVLQLGNLGIGGNLRLYHNTSNSYIDNQATGHIFIRNNVDTDFGANIYIQPKSGESSISAINDGAVELYYNGNKKFETNSNGVSITGRITSSSFGNQGDFSGQFGRIRVGADTYGNTIRCVTDTNFNLASNNTIAFYIGGATDGTSFGTGIAFFDSSGLLPSTSNTYDLGAGSRRWRNIYTNDLNLSNEGGKNDVDGTWGNYTIQEGESDLFLINKRNGKKYKFNLTEVS